MNFFLILVLTVTFLPIFAQPNVDGVASDWTGIAPTSDNSSKYSANSAGTITKLTEWIWKDASGDNRTDNFGNFVDGSKQDIQEIRLAADNTNLYYLAKFPSNIDKTPGDGSLQLQITLRRAGSASTQEFLASFSDSRVPTASSPGGNIPDARWDFLIRTLGGSSGTNNSIFNSSFTESFAGSYTSNSTDGILEGSVPWTSLGGTPSNGEKIVFTFSLYRANTSNNAFDTGGDNSKGSCLDMVTTTVGNTFGALIGVSDGGTNNQGRLDYAQEIVLIGQDTQQPTASVSDFNGTTLNATFNDQGIGIIAVKAEVINNATLTIDGNNLLQGAEFNPSLPSGMLNFQVSGSSVSSLSLIITDFSGNRTVWLFDYF